MYILKRYNPRHAQFRTYLLLVTEANIYAIKRLLTFWCRNYFF